MGIQNQLTDVSTDSLPLFLLSTFATGACYLHSLIFTFLGFPPNPPDDVTVTNSTLNLNHHLNLNRLLSYPHASSDQDSVCIVCLNRLAAGDHVHKLTCLHVFHKDCFDGWLHHLNFNCPLCRSPVGFDERVEVTRRRWLVDDVMEWFRF